MVTLWCSSAWEWEDHMPRKAFRVNAAIWDEKGKWESDSLKKKKDRILREYRGKITQYFHDILSLYKEHASVCHV